MGRPIKAKFFGNLNNEQFKNVGINSGIGGEGVSSTIVVTNTGSGYTQGSVAVFSAPQEPTGTRATGHATFTANGTGAFGISDVVIDNKGTGYISAPTISITTATAVTTRAGASTNGSFTLTNIVTTGIYPGMKVDAPAAMQANTYVSAVSTNTVTLNKTQSASSATNVFTFNDYGRNATFTTSLTASNYNALKVNAYLLAKDGGTCAKLADIVKQEASHRYLVKTSEGIGQCRLVASSALTAGQMNLVATDWNGSTYYVTKLTAHKAVLSQSTASGSFLIANGHATGWTLGAATGTVVTLANV
jgi:hypothetical protein